MNYRHDFTGKIYQIELKDNQDILLSEVKTGQDLLVSRLDFLDNYSMVIPEEDCTIGRPRRAAADGRGMHMNGSSAATFRGYGVRCNFN